MTVTVMGLGAIAIALPAQAEAPGIYYSWRSLEIDMDQCLVRSQAALAGSALTDIVVDGNNVSGRSETATALFICLENAVDTTIMLTIASNDDESALLLREALKQAF
ncbi:MAG: hypothetical protein HC886_23640 [Leptolyngbyaceae cyanobacterium SM1_1_3]|nr:hypothetical protein [Leptolyngbyaceae cyanobacterium SM1_1_3]NJO12069.1 hypothetical protein [Leptolyngbyaceae cyanobacterium SL_1_1]